MLRAKDGDFFISDWLRNRNTVEFLGIWEKINNPNFNYGEFALIRNQAGLNSYKVSVKEWVEKTGAIGLRTTTGRYGGTFAHKDAKRALTKINYKIHTDSIKENIVLPNKLSKQDAVGTYASEADILNKALFGMTAQEWKSNNKTKEGNMRDYADVYQLICLANLESLNAEFIKMEMSQKERLMKLNETAISQMKSLQANNSVKKLLK